MPHARTMPGCSIGRPSRRRRCPTSERLLAKDAGNPGYLNLKAAILANLGDYQGSIDLYSKVLRDHPRQPKVWMSLGSCVEDGAPAG